MSLFKAFLDTLQAGKAELAKQARKFNNRGFMQAVAAGCALVAAADGTISADEKKKMAGFIQRSPVLADFNLGEVIAAFTKIADDMEFDFAYGKGEALKKIAAIAGKDPEQSVLLVRICCAIGAADGNFDDQEQAVVREICAAVGTAPSQFNL